MTGHNILGPTDSVIIGTNGRSVVPDMRLCQLVSTSEIVRISVAAMPELSHAPNNFPIPVMWTNVLGPSDDCNVSLQSCDGPNNNASE